MGEVPSSGDILSAVVAGLDLRQHMEWKPRTVESRKKKLQRALRNGEDVSSAEMCRVYESIVRAFIGADLLRSATDLSDVDQRMYDADEGGVSFLAPAAALAFRAMGPLPRPTCWRSRASRLRGTGAH